MARPFRLHASRRRQRGAVAVLAAVAMVAMLVATMLAVEIGRMYTSHRQLQKLASMAAMDAVRVVGGCDSLTPPTLAGVQSEVGQSLVRNSAGDMFVDGSEVALGYVVTRDGQRMLEPSPADEATAVGVSLTQPFPTPMLPLIPSRAGRMMGVTAVATQEVIGAVSVGTSLLSLDTGDSVLLNGLLGGLVGDNVALSLVTYEGLANSQVSLLDLAQLGAGVATPGDLLDLQVSLPQALQIIATTLEQTGVASQNGVSGVLESLAALVDPNRKSIRFGDVIGIEEGVEDLAAKLPLNTLELTMALAQAAAEGYPITIPVAASIPGLGGIEVLARIGSPPTIALGRPGFREDGSARTSARTSQVYLELSASLLDLGPLRALVPLLPAGAAISLNMVAEVAPATATLSQVRCAYSGRPHHEVTVDATSGVARVAVGSFNSLHAAVPQIVAPPPLLDLGLLSIDLDNPVIVEVGDHEASPDFEGPFVPRVPQVIPAQHVAEIGDGVGVVLDDVGGELAGDLATELQFSGLLGGVLDALAPAARQALLASLLEPGFDLLDAVLGDLLTLLGVQLGTATVTIESLEIKQPSVFNKN